MNRQRIVIICPGRGSYTRETQGYLKKYIQSSSNKIKYMDDERNNAGLPTLTEIDSQTFKARVHMKGEHASTLIYACSLIDYYSITMLSTSLHVPPSCLDSKIQWAEFFVGGERIKN